MIGFGVFCMTSLIPVPDGDWWPVCRMPDLGGLNGPDTSRQHVVDHGFLQDVHGRWQLWACIRGTRVGRLLFGWEGASLDCRDWPERGVMLRADSGVGERVIEGEEFVGAPFLARIEGGYYSFYHSDSIRMMRSDDGVEYRRVPGAEPDGTLYPDGGRDVMVMTLGDTHYFYSTVSLSADADSPGSSHVILRTTRDLVTFSDPVIVSRGGRGGVGRVDAESPFVVHLEGAFYLFRASSISFKTFVYRSDRPDAFGIDDDSGLIAEYDIKAPELIVHEGQWYISDVHNFQGVRLSRLSWTRDS